MREQLVNISKITPTLWSCKLLTLELSSLRLLCPLELHPWPLTCKKVWMPSDALSSTVSQTLISFLRLQFMLPGNSVNSKWCKTTSTITTDTSALAKRIRNKFLKCWELLDSQWRPSEPVEKVTMSRSKLVEQNRETINFSEQMNP